MDYSVFSASDKFVNSDDSATSAFNWKNGYPSEAAKKPCVYMTNGLWKNYDCYYAMYPVCQKGPKTCTHKREN